MWLHSVLLSIALSCCCSAGGVHDNQAAAMTMGNAQSPSSAPQHSELDPEALWRTKVLDLLTELVLIQREAAKTEEQIVKQLSMLGTQGSQQIQDLQNVARHQSLLVENHQALLLQTSRIGTTLQELSKKSANERVPSSPAGQ